MPVPKRHTEAEPSNAESGSLIFILGTLCLTYTLVTRRWMESLHYAGGVTLALFVTGLMLGGIILLDHPDSRNFRSIIKYIVWLAIITAGLTVFYYSVGCVIFDLFMWLKEPRALRGVVAVIAVVSVALGLFIFRLRLRSCYGLTEFFAGVGVAIAKVSSFGSQASIANGDLALALLTASVYLIVRGLDNIREGLVSEKAPDPVANDILKSFGRSLVADSTDKEH